MSFSPDFDGPRLLRLEELSASRRLSQICFQDIPDSEDNEPEMPPQYQEGQTFLIAAAGRPVSQISTFLTPLKIYDGVVRVGSIGGVCTHPDYRGHGLATRLMEHCTRHLVQSGAGLMLISGGRGLYTRLGNVPSGKYAGFHLKSGEFRLPVSALPDIRLCPVNVSDAPATIDAAACSRLYHAEPVRFQRNMAKFQTFFHPREAGYHAEQWIVELEGRPAAYLLLNMPWKYFGRPGAGVRSIEEYAGSRVALVRGIAAALNWPGINEIQAPIPWQDVDLIYLLRQYGGKPRWTGLEDHTMRLINFPALMSGLRLYTQSRLEPALRRGLRFEQSGSLLGGEGEGCCVVVRGRDRLELDTASMTRLVIGDPYGKLGEISFPGALAEIIPALFPLPSFLPGLDYH